MGGAAELHELTIHMRRLREPPARAQRAPSVEPRAHRLVAAARALDGALERLESFRQLSGSLQRCAVRVVRLGVIRHQRRAETAPLRRELMLSRGAVRQPEVGIRGTEARLELEENLKGEIWEEWALTYGRNGSSEKKKQKNRIQR